MKSGEMGGTQQEMASPDGGTDRTAPTRILSRIRSRIQAFREALAGMKTVGDLLDAIPEDLPEKVAYGLLTLWILSPLFVMARNLPLPVGDAFDQMLRHSATTIFWSTLLWQLGLLGCFTGLLDTARLFRALRENHPSPRSRLASFARARPVPVLLLLLLFWSLASALLSNQPGRSLWGDPYRRDGFLTYLAYAGLFSCGLLVRSQERRHRLMTRLAGVATGLAILSLLPAWPILERVGIRSGMGVFMNTNHFAYYLGLSIPAALLLILSDREHRSPARANRLPVRVSRLLWLVAFGIQSAALVNNGSLGPYLAVVIALAAAGVLLRFGGERGSVRQLLPAYGLFLAVTMAETLLKSGLSMDMSMLLNDTGLILAGSDAAGAAGSGRWILWVRALDFVAERPLFGFGPDNLGARYALEGIGIDRPHNEVLQVAASLGIPALLLYLSALAVHVRRFFLRLGRLPVSTRLLFAALAAYLLSSLTGNSMYYTTPFFFLALGLSVGLLEEVPS